MEHVWKFSYFGTETESNIENEKGTRAYELMEKLNNHEKISDEDKKWISLESANSTCVRHQLCRNGWAYDFRPFMKRYAVKIQGKMYEVFSFNKKVLKSTYKGVTEMYEIPNPLSYKRL